MKNLTALIRSIDSISSDIGILHHVVKLPRLSNDPRQINYGIWPSDTSYLSGEKYAGRSAGCAENWDDAMLGTIGETVERYATAFYNVDESVFSSFSDLKKHAVHPKEFALFHDEQYDSLGFPVRKFDQDIKVTWFPTYDLTNGKETWLPGQFIYMPFSQDEKFITANTSTGLAAHTNYHKAILTGLYEVLERDSFVITWMQEIVTGKIFIDADIKNYIDSKFPAQYEWHFFDITYDLEVPSILGICIGESDYGPFIAVGSATRQTFSEALRKVIQEIGQAVPYFRYLLGEKKDWTPNDNYNEITDFEHHSIFYTKRQDLFHVFDKWRAAKPGKRINFNESVERDDISQIRYMLTVLKAKGYNVLFKDITTADIRQIGFYSIKVFVPQLIQLAGAYAFYFLGGDRLYQVPRNLGLKSKDFNELNKFPHPFP